MDGWLAGLNLTKAELRATGEPLSKVLRDEEPLTVRRGLEAVRAPLLNHASRATEIVFAAHPAGYSTTKRDLVRDLFGF